VVAVAAARAPRVPDAATATTDRNATPRRTRAGPFAKRYWSHNRRKSQRQPTAWARVANWSFGPSSARAPSAGYRPSQSRHRPGSSHRTHRRPICCFCCNTSWS